MDYDPVIASDDPLTDEELLAAGFDSDQFSRTPDGVVRIIHTVDGAMRDRSYTAVGPDESGSGYMMTSYVETGYDDEYTELGPHWYGSSRVWAELRRRTTNTTPDAA